MISEKRIPDAVCIAALREYLTVFLFGVYPEFLEMSNDVFIAVLVKYLLYELPAAMIMLKQVLDRTCMCIIAPTASCE